MRQIIKLFMLLVCLSNAGLSMAETQFSDGAVTEEGAPLTPPLPPPGIDVGVLDIAVEDPVVSVTLGESASAPVDAGANMSSGSDSSMQPLP
jgi:hypothetical protein